MANNSSPTQEDIENLIHKHVKTLVLKNITMKVSKGENKDHFLGFISRVIIKGMDKENSEKTLNWIVKTAPQSEIYRRMFNTGLAYAREAYIYETVLPKFRNFEKEKSITNPFNEYAEFVASYLENLNENIIMEDMTASGYVMRNRQRALDLNHVKLVMKAYAKLHALSYAFKDQRPEDFEDLARNTEDIFGKLMKKDSYESQQGIINKAMKSLDPIEDAEVIKIFEKYTKTYIDIQIAKCQETNRYSVIGHGDSWVNNMMWKYEDPKRPTYPTKLCLLDWQLARYCSPACDLSYFLFTCTSKQFRDKHYDQMIKFYYYTLCSHLAELGSDPRQCLPFEALQEELKRFSVVGLYMTVLVLNVITRYNPDVGKYKDDFEEEPITILSHDERYKDRVRGVIVDFYEKGYFDYE